MQGCKILRGRCTCARPRGIKNSCIKVAWFLEGGGTGIKRLTISSARREKEWWNFVSSRIREGVERTYFLNNWRSLSALNHSSNDETIRRNKKKNVLSTVDLFPRIEDGEGLRVPSRFTTRVSSGLIRDQQSRSARFLEIEICFVLALVAASPLDRIHLVECTSLPLDDE